MKKNFFCLAILGLIFLRTEFSTGQNLVSNCSFEQYDTCPDNAGQIQRAIAWFKSSGTPDYFNTCSSNPLWTVPPQINYQLAALGNAFAGANFFSLPDGSIEIIRANLSSPLVTGTTYYVSFKVSLCSNPSSFYNLAVNKIGAKFTTGPPPEVNNSAHVYSNTMILDSVNWTTISGSFVADSAYTRLHIGVFFDTAAVTVGTIAPSPLDRAYYYIDDVSVSPNFSDPCTLVGIEEASGENSFLLFPIPATDRFTIYGLRGTVSKIEVYNLFGEKLLAEPVTSNPKQVTISVPDFPPGIYFLAITDEKKNRVTRRFIKL